MSKISIWVFLLNVLKLFDVAFNVIILGFLRLFINLPPAAGNCHYTTSEALAEMRERGSKAGCFFCKVLSIAFKPFHLTTVNYDHCAESLIGIPEDIASS